jgi:hypothetical protein
MIEDFSSGTHRILGLRERCCLKADVNVAGREVEERVERERA